MYVVSFSGLDLHYVTVGVAWLWQEVSQMIHRMMGKVAQCVQEILRFSYVTSESDLSVKMIGTSGGLE